MSNIKINPDYKYEKTITIKINPSFEVKVNNKPDSVVTEIELVDIQINQMENFQQAGKGKEDVAGAEFDFLINNKLIKAKGEDQPLSKVSISAKLAYAIHRKYVDAFLSVGSILTETQENE